MPQSHRLLWSACATLLPVFLIFPQACASAAPPPRAPSLCRTWYPDCDKDGFGDPSQPLVSCANPNLTNPGACPFRRNGDDCNDANTSVNPDAAEDSSHPPDGVDNDCDGYVDIDCDGTERGANPQIILETPARGLATTAPQAEVSGLVLPGAEGSPIASLTLNGTALGLERCSQDGGARFSATVPLSIGLHTLSLRATDEAGRLDMATTSYEHADTFVPVLENPLPQSFTALLNQGSWNLLADAMESLLEPDELEAVLLSSNPLVDEAGKASCLDSYSLEADASSYSHQDVQITFTVLQDMVRATARLVAPVITAEGVAIYDLSWNCGGFGDTVALSGEASFSEVFASADGYLSLSNGQLGIDFRNVVVDARDPQISVTANDWLYDWLLDLFEEQLAAETEIYLEEMLETFVSEAMGPALAAELNSLELDYPIVMGDVIYQVSFGYDSLAVIPGSVGLGFSMELSVPPTPSLPDHPGVLWRSTTAAPTTTPTFVMKTPLNFFNSSLQALFEGGSLEVTMPLATSPNIVGSSHLLLPPVVMEADDPYLLELSIGDVLVDLSIEEESGTLTPVEVALSASVPLGLLPYADGEVIGFDVSFGSPSMAYDALGEEALPSELVPVVTAALQTMAAELLLEVEVYLESLKLSYLELPLQINGLELLRDPANSAVLSLEGEAFYTGG